MAERFPPGPPPRFDERTVVRPRGPLRGGALPPGTVLGNTYVIEAQLGHGPLGDVYRARHLELGTAHTIKLISPALAGDPRAVQLLLEEARRLSRVRHDAIINYEGLFRDAQGLRYLVTEFIEGPSLATVIAARRLEPDEVLKLRDRLADGLAAVHALGIIHRDVCPDNIVLPGGEIGRAKLGEFGFATTGDARDPTLLGVNLQARFAFASPEQLGLYGGRIDLRSDLYSLGLVLAAAALGFGRRLDMSASLPAAIAARQRPPDLAALPPALRPVIAPLLMPRPEDRPASLRAGGGGAGAAMPQPRWGVGRWAVAATLAALLAAAALAIGFYRPALLAGSDAALQRRLADATEGYGCAEISSHLLPDGAVRVSGHLASQADLVRLRRTVAALPGVTKIDFAVSLMPHPHCDVVKLLAPLAQNADGAALAFAGDADGAYVGARPALNVRAPGFDSYVYIDYFDAGSGQVLHLFPNARERFNLRPWRNRFVLFKSGLWTLCGNVGRQLITLVAAGHPLFARSRPEVEDAAAYLARLARALHQQAQAKRAAVLRFFPLSEAPQWISREQACPGG